MLSFLRRRRPESDFSMMMRACAEANERARLEAALDSLDIDVGDALEVFGFERSVDANDYGVVVVSLIVSEVMSRVVGDMGALTKTEALIGALFTTTYSDHITRLTNGSFEKVAMAAPILTFPTVDVEAVADLAARGITLFNELQQRAQIVQVAGQCLAVWIENPEPENFNLMVDSYRKVVARFAYLDQAEQVGEDTPAE